jgi:hypothetical protein
VTRGTYPRWDARSTVEDQVNRLDVAELRRAGRLWPGNRFVTKVIRTRGGRAGAETVEVVVSGEDRAESLRLDGETVYLDRTPCNYGGDRPWFRCPGCDRRVAYLYGGWRRWRCRHCLDLAYKSTRSPAWSKLMAQALALEDKLGWVTVSPGGSLAPGRYPLKPKGMHWRTFERLWKACYRANAAAVAAMRPWIDRANAEIETGWRRLEELETRKDGA